MRGQVLDLVLDQPGRQLVGQRRRHERVEARANVDVRVAGDLDEQRTRPDVPVSVLGALAGPHVVGHEEAVRATVQSARGVVPTISAGFQSAITL